MSRFVEITGKSKCRKESEINKGKELPESILAKSAKLNINENLNLNKSKQENIDIFTKSLLLPASSIENVYKKLKTRLIFGTTNGWGVLLH